MRCGQLQALLERLRHHRRMHPFDMIAFDGDGHSIPEVDVDVQADVRAEWQALNAVEVPSIR